MKARCHQKNTTVFTISQLLGPSIIALYGVADKTPILISVFIHIISMGNKLIAEIMVANSMAKRLPIHWTIRRAKGEIINIPIIKIIANLKFLR